MVDVVPWHGLDVHWGPVLLFLCGLGAMGLGAAQGQGARRIPLLWGGA